MCYAVCNLICFFNCASTFARLEGGRARQA